MKILEKIGNVGIVIWLVFDLVAVVLYFNPYLFRVLPGSIDSEIRPHLLSSTQEAFYQDMEFLSWIESDDFVGPTPEEVYQQLMWLP